MAGSSSGTSSLFLLAGYNDHGKDLTGFRKSGIYPFGYN